MFHWLFGTNNISSGIGPFQQPAQTPSSLAPAGTTAVSSGGTGPYTQSLYPQLSMQAQQAQSYQNQLVGQQQMQMQTSTSISINQLGQAGQILTTPNGNGLAWINPYQQQTFSQQLNYPYILDSLKKYSDKERKAHLEGYYLGTPYKYSTLEDFLERTEKEFQDILKAEHDKEFSQDVKDILFTKDE